MDIVENNVENGEMANSEFVVPPSHAPRVFPNFLGQFGIHTIITGGMVHGRLIPWEETSGSIISEVRKRAKKIAKEENRKTILVDCSLGIACNIISTIK